MADPIPKWLASLAGFSPWTRWFPLEILEEALEKTLIRICKGNFVGSVKRLFHDAFRHSKQLSGEATSLVTQFSELLDENVVKQIVDPTFPQRPRVDFKKLYDRVFEILRNDGPQCEFAEFQGSMSYVVVMAICAGYSPREIGKELFSDHGTVGMSNVVITRYWRAMIKLRSKMTSIDEILDDTPFFFLDTLG